MALCRATPSGFTPGQRSPVFCPLAAELIAASCESGAKQEESKSSWLEGSQGAGGIQVCF